MTPADWTPRVGERVEVVQPEPYRGVGVVARAAREGFWVRYDEPLPCPLRSARPLDGAWFDRCDLRPLPPAPWVPRVGDRVMVSTLDGEAPATITAVLDYAPAVIAEYDAGGGATAHIDCLRPLPPAPAELPRYFVSPAANAAVAAHMEAQRRAPVAAPAEPARPFAVGDEAEAHDDERALPGRIVRIHDVDTGAGCVLESWPAAPTSSNPCGIRHASAPQSAPEYAPGDRVLIESLDDTELPGIVVGSSTLTPGGYEVSTPTGTFHPPAALVRRDVSPPNPPRAITPPARCGVCGGPAWQLLTSSPCAVEGGCPGAPWWSAGPSLMIVPDVRGETQYHAFGGGVESGPRPSEALAIAAWRAAVSKEGGR
jgi:hypothetical protein